MLKFYDYIFIAIITIISIPLTISTMQYFNIDTSYNPNSVFCGMLIGGIFGTIGGLLIAGLYKINSNRKKTKL